MASNSTVSIISTTTISHYCTMYPIYCNRPLQITIGTSLFITAVPILCLTLIVIIAQFKSGNLSKGGTSIFVLSTWQLSISAIILIIIGFYVGPTIFFQSRWPDVVKLSSFSYHLGQIIFALIFCGSMFNVVIAISRMLTIQDGMTNKIFSRFTYNVIAIIIIPTGFILSYVPSYTMSCCKLYYDYSIYTIFSFNIDLKTYATLENVAFKYVYRPIFIISTVIPILCYTYIFGYVFWIRRQLKSMKNTNRNELIRSLLFAMIFFFYMCSWVYYDLLLVSELFDPTIPLYILSIVFMMLEAAVNAILQTFMISSIREAIKKMFNIKEKSKITPLFSQSEAPQNRVISNT